MEENNVQNDVQITSDAIAVIVRMAIKDVEGVGKIATGISGGITEALGKNDIGKGVKAEITGNDVKINLDIIIKYGAKIQEVAGVIKEKVKEDIETMTGLNVTAINITVQGIETTNKTEEEKKVEEQYEVHNALND